MRPFFSSFISNRRLAVGGSGSVSVQAKAYWRYVVDPNDATCSVTFSSTGTTSGSGTSSYNWLLSGVGSDYEIRATVTAGAITAGTTGSWLSLGSSRSWSLTQTTAGTSSATVLFEIRSASSGTTLASASSTLEATVDM